MKLTGSQEVQFNTVLGRTVALVFEKDKLNSEWYVIRRITIDTDVTGEFETIKLGLCSIKDDKWVGEYELSSIKTKKEVEELYDAALTATQSQATMFYIPEYMRDAPKEEVKLNKLLNSYPGDFAGVHNA